jgi:hypothetical protein
MDFCHCDIVSQGRENPPPCAVQQAKYFVGLGLTIEKIHLITVRNQNVAAAQTKQSKPSN